MGTRIFKSLRKLLLRKHLRHISFTLGTITFQEWLETVLFLLFGRENLVNGKYVKQFESAFSEYIGAKYAFSFGAGRMAFYAILKAMDIKAGDEVILPGYTCVVVPNAVIYAGAKPVYVDINPDDFTIDARKIEAKITPNTKIIMVQPMFSSFCDMETISQIAAKYNLKVIEDCAHALGADYNGKKAGNFSDAAFFTMEQSKIITTWMGGMAVTNNVALAEKLQATQFDTEFLDRKATTKLVVQLVLHYLFRHPVTYLVGGYFLWLLSILGILMPNILPEEIDGVKPEKYPIRLSNIQAKIGLKQLRNIGVNLKHRREVAAIYEDTLKELGLSIYQADNYNSAHIRYAFLVKERENLKEIFTKNQAELGEWYNSVIYPRDSSLEALYYQAGSCPVAEFTADHCVNLPTHSKINSRDVSRIIRLLQRHSNLLLNPHKEDA